MSTLLAGVALFSLVSADTPESPTAMAAIVQRQQAEARRDIRIDIQADLERRGALFFSENGELHQLLGEVQRPEGALAAR